MVIAFNILLIQLVISDVALLIKILLETDRATIFQISMTRYFFIFCLILYTSHSPLKAQISPLIIDGFLDLSEWDFETKGSVNLSGEWDFYWNQLIPPDQVDIRKENRGRIPITVPNDWSNFKYQGTSIPWSGFATYHLRIKLPQTGARLAMKIKEIGTAYKLYINGQEVMSNGVVGKNAFSSSPWFQPHVADFNHISNSLNIVIHVSNFHKKQGGIRQSILLGTHSQLLKRENLSNTEEIFLVGAIFIMGLYHIGLFWNRRDKRSPLYFGIWCLLVSLRILTMGERNIIDLLPMISWEWLVKLEYLAFYLSIPTFGLYVYSLYRDEYKKQILWFFLFTGGVFSLGVFFTPVIIFTRSLIFYQLTTVLFSCHILYVLFVAFLKKREDAKIFLTGFVILFAVVLNDLLYTNGIIESIFLAEVGTFIFLFIQSFILSSRFSKAFSTAEKLSAENKRLYLEIDEYSRNLEVKVEKRTQELSAANITKDKFFSLIAHDLRGPIGNISVVLNEVFHPGEPVQEGILTAVQQSAKNTYTLLEDLLTWSRSQKGEIKVRPTVFDMDQLIDESVAVFLCSAKIKGIELTIIRSDISSKVIADRSMIRSILRNLLNNAIKFCFNGDKVTVSISLNSDEFTVSVTDTGVGMAPELVKKLFLIGQEEVVNLGTCNERGSGLGLILCKEFISANTGEIGVKSEIGTGSTFWITLPAVSTSDSIFLDQQNITIERLKQHLVLIVDDNPLNINVTGLVLERMGVNWESAANGQDGYEKIMNNNYGLILMDIEMPVLNGIESTRKIRETMSNPPWITLTTYPENDLHSMAKEVQFDGYLEKPLSKLDFLTILDPLLTKSGNYSI